MQQWVTNTNPKTEQEIYTGVNTQLELHSGLDIGKVSLTFALVQLENCLNSAKVVFQL